MSWQATRWARDQRAGSATAKIVLMVLAEQADEAGYSFLSHATIAERAEITRRAVVAQMKVLAGAGLIVRSRRNDALGHRTSDHLQLAMIGQSQSEPDAPREAPQSEPGALRGDPKVNVDARQSEPGSHEKVLEKENKSSGSAKRAHSIQEGFPSLEVIERERSFLRSQGWNIDPSHEAQRFRAHAETHDRKVKNWPAAFRNWILGAIARAPASAKIAPLPTAAAAPAPADLWRQRVAAFADPGNQHWNATEWGPKPGKPGCAVPAGVLAEFRLGPDNVIPLRGGAA